MHTANALYTSNIMEHEYELKVILKFCKHVPLNGI